MVRTIRWAAKANDGKKVADTAHQMKGSCSSFGLRNLANQFETAMKQAESGTDIQTLAEDKWEAETLEELKATLSALRQQRALPL